MDTAIIGNPLALRETLGWSRNRLARASKVTISAVHLLERLGWAGSPDDNRIVSTLQLAVTERLEAIATLKEMAFIDVVKYDRRFRRVPEQKHAESRLGWNLIAPPFDPSI